MIAPPLLIDGRRGHKGDSHEVRPHFRNLLVSRCARQAVRIRRHVERNKIERLVRPSSITSMSCTLATNPSRHPLVLAVLGLLCVVGWRGGMSGSMACSGAACRGAIIDAECCGSEQSSDSSSCNLCSSECSRGIALGACVSQGSDAPDDARPCCVICPGCCRTGNLPMFVTARTVEPFKHGDASAESRPHTPFVTRLESLRVAQSGCRFALTLRERAPARAVLCVWTI